MQDDDIFRAEMQDVKPLAQTRAELKAERRAASLAQQARRLAAQQENGQDENFLGEDFIPPVKSDDILRFNKPGIQHGVLRKLRLGQYTIDARLDLHKHTVAQARVAVFDFIQDSMRYDVRTGLIVHGRGARSQPQKAMIKSCVNHWLQQLPEVLAFHSAQKHHGGVGAVYVLLRKSERQKQKTRETIKR
ncbi:MAG: DNA endonuclease SmrA [Pseudomonadales bacterium]